MTKLTQEQEIFICEEINKSIEEKVSKIRKSYIKIIGSLGVVILLETGALVWSLATGVSENNHQDEAINQLSITVNDYIKSNNELVQSLAGTTIKNTKDIESTKKDVEKSEIDIKDVEKRLNRSPY